ncbi:MAG: TolC family protein [Micavibrio sp.]|nr:TolC family protein [Micavibrio sp.]
MIRNFLCALTVTTALVMPCSVYAASLSDSVSQALQTHPILQAKKASEQSAADNLREQKAGYFPVLGIEGRGGRINQDDDTTRANTGGDAATSWLGEGSVTLTEPLFTGFGTVNRVAAAKDRLTSAGFDSRGSAEEVALKAARAHLNLMRTRDLLSLATEYLASIQQRQDSISLMVNEGASEESDLLQANEALMAVKTTRLGYEEAYRQAEADFIEVVGAAPADKLDFGQQTWDKLIPPTVDAAISLARDDNPNVRAADSMVSALGRDADVARSDIYPRVDAEMSYLQKDQHEDLGGELKSAQAMLKMSWNFSTGGAQLAKVDKSLSERKEAQARRDAARRMVEHDVRQKFTSMQIVDEQFGLMQQREDAADKIVANFMNQFEGGKQSNLQLISANSRLFEAKAARVDAQYRQLLSRFELLNAMGRLQTAFGVAAPTATASK